MSGEKRKFAVFDIDGTLFRWQLFHELVFELKDYFSDESRDKLEHSFNAWGAREGKWQAYEHAVMQAFEDHASGISSTIFDKAVERVVERSGKKLYAYTRNLAKKLKGEGYFLIALSGSHQEVAERFGALYNFDLSVGTVFERVNDRLSDVISFEAFSDKGKRLSEIVQKYELTFEDSWGIGDSKSDASMLALVRHPIAFNPAEELLEIAEQKGWPIVIERKSIVYHLEKDPHGSYLLAQTDRL